MSSAVMSLLISHILTFVESELVKNEPEIVQAVIGDIQSLITKLEGLIAGKSANAAAIATPVLNAVSNAAVAAVQAVGETVAAQN